MFSQKFSQKYLFIAIFLIFSFFIIGSILYYSPSWGLMDDCRNLNIAKSFWGGKGQLIKLIHLIKNDLTFHGRFRPLYQLWVVTTYRIFYNFPLGLYIVITVSCLLILLLWGLIIHRLFSNDSSDFYFNLFIYPLSFFIFTPFWNNFMYISILEKFVYIFSSLSIYLHLIAYDRRKISYLLLSLSLAIFGLLGKETGLSLIMAYFLYSLFDLLIFKKDYQLSLVSCITNGAIFSGYYFFIKSFWGEYTSRYANNFSLITIFNNLLNAPIVIKGLLVFALISICAYFLLRRKFGNIRQEAIIIPLFLVFYLFVLSPWGFTNYLLAPLAPFVMVTVYPVYQIGNANKKLKLCKNFCLIALSFLVLFYIVIPRISKMGDIKKIVNFISSVESKNSQAKYFFPPPFPESASAMSILAEADIRYLADGVLDGSMLSEKVKNYLIFGDECTKVTIKDSSIEKEIYSNNTWKIYLIKKKVGNEAYFNVDFSKNFLQRLKDHIKKL